MLRESFIFRKKVEVDDGAGNYTGTFQDQFTVRADLIYREGSEAVIASRLEQKVPAFLKIRKSQLTDLITTDWCCVNENTREVFNIRAKTPDQKTRLYYLLTLEGGVAA